MGKLIDWHGGDCPVDTAELVDIRQRCGNVIKQIPAGAFAWCHAGRGSDIVRYRISNTSQEKQEGNALNVQIGGDHYKECKIQPVEFIEANGLGFLEGCCVKRLARHDKPTGNGRQDIEKAIHELQLLLQLRYGDENK